MRVNVIEFIIAMIFLSVAITLIGSLLIDVLGAVFQAKALLLKGAEPTTTLAAAVGLARLARGFLVRLQITSVRSAAKS